MKKIIILLLLVFTFSSCSNVEKESTNDWKIKIVSSIIPFSSIVNYIWGNKVAVSTLIPSGVSPHNFDLKVKDMLKINDSDIIFSLWIEHIDWFLDKLETKNNIVKLIRWVNILYSNDSHEHNHNEKEVHYEEENYEEKSHNIDPHVWLWINNIKIISLRIKSELIKSSPENKDLFEKNYNNFIKELDLIVSNYKKNTLSLEQKDFIIYHDAYNYLFDSFWIEQWKKHIFQGIVWANNKIWDLKKLTHEIKEKNIKYIFVEPQFNDSNIRKIANEYSMDIFVLDPLWEDSSSLWYLNNLEKNLENLSKIYK